MNVYWCIGNRVSLQRVVDNGRAEREKLLFDNYHSIASSLLKNWDQAIGLHIVTCFYMVAFHVDSFQANIYNN